MMVLALACIVTGAVLFAASRRSSPNDGIGRYQMLVTNHGTLIIMDTVSGAVASRYKVEDQGTREVPPRKEDHP
jgi:hypothetical protein